MDNLNNSLPLPPGSMPECWSRDERMNSLFAEFRNRSVNNQDWDSKYKFWQELISDWLSYKQLCSFSVSELNVAFKRNGHMPRCLKTVVEELLQNGEIIPEVEFLKNSNHGWTAWAIDIMLKRPVIWSFSKLKNYMVKHDIDNEAKYIHIKTLKELSNLILQTIDEDNDNILLSLSQITKNCMKKSGNNNITEANVKMALLWLRNSNKAAFRSVSLHNKNELLVKISTHGVSAVSEAEEGLFKLMEQEKAILKNIEHLEMEKNAVLLKAKSHLDDGLRELAKTCIRKKKDIDKSIDKRAATLHNIQMLIARIHDAHSNTEVLAAYKTGSEILKNFAGVGLNEENVTNTIDDMSEAAGELADLQTIMSTTIGTLESDLDLEDELEQLLESSHENDMGETGKPTLPDVTNLPDISKNLATLNLEDSSLSSQTSIDTNSLCSTQVKDKANLIKQT